MGFTDFLRESRRLDMLNVLAQAPGGQMNMPTVQSALKGIGHRVSRSELLEEAAWLEDRGLLLRDYEGPLLILTLTERGGEAAEGVVRVDGVKRPPFRS